MQPLGKLQTNCLHGSYHSLTCPIGKPNKTPVLLCQILYKVGRQSPAGAGVYVVKTYFVFFVVLCVLCAPKMQEHEGHKRCTKNTKNNLCFAYTHAPEPAVFPISLQTDSSLSLLISSFKFLSSYSYLIWSIKFFR